VGQRFGERNTYIYIYIYICVYACGGGKVHSFLNSCGRERMQRRSFHRDICHWRRKKKEDSNFLLEVRSLSRCSYASVDINHGCQSFIAINGGVWEPRMAPTSNSPLVALLFLSKPCGAPNKWKFGK
jgi:hypothetical protein